MFRFKQFTIHQDRCAMKVGTDGVLLGAWTALPFSGKALDIGTGTGLLSLMLAQREPALYIDALEIDTEASLQAKENFEQSAWANRIQIIPLSLQGFYPNKANAKYDLIISNPPFFQSGQQIKNTSRRIARHNDSLSFEELFFYASQLLNPEGSFSIVVPYDVQDKIQTIATKNKLFTEKMLLIYPNNKAFSENKPKRLLISFSFKKMTLKTEQIIIEPEQRHHYSEAYKALTKDFYLHF